MAWYPKAIRKPVDRYKPGGSSHVSMPNPGRLCLHTAVSSGDSLFGLFNTPGNAVAHFYIRKDGKVEQYVSTDTRASANLEGNHDIISVESWDDGGRRETWTSAQAEAAAQLAAWVHEKHNIPLQRCPSSRPGTKGITWHRQGIDGNFPQQPGDTLGGRVNGGEKWSNSFGKVCPFDGKILGTVNDIIPRARQIVEGDWFDMATKEDLRQVVDAALKAERNDTAGAVWAVNIGPEDAVETARDRLRGADFQATQANEKVGTLAQDFATFRSRSFNRDKALAEKLSTLADNCTDDATKQELFEVRDELLVQLG